MPSQPSGCSSQGGQVGSEASSSLDAPSDEVFESKCSTLSDTTYQRASFLEVLASAQTLGIEIISTTWNPNLEKLGAGATAKINQNLISIQTSFAFKNTKGPLEDSFRVLLCELAVLGHPLVQRHPNISQLLGICWEYCSEEDVRPVLVFEKLSHGNLGAFLTSTDGRELTSEKRLSVCAQVATAIASMHQYGIIHGDIRPENVLVSLNDGTGVVLAKVSDFGYSTVLSDSQSVIDLARTPPWADPEAHRRGSSFLDAKKSDIYSFGLLSLWTLLHEHTESDLQTKDPYAWITDSIEQGNLESVARARLDGLAGLSVARKVCFWRFLESTVFVHREARTSDLGDIISHLGDHRHPDIIAPNTEGLDLKTAAATDFQVSKDLRKFLSARYALRKHIYMCLLEEYGRLQHAAFAFNLAFCYTIGFGTHANSEEAALFLVRSGKTHQNIEELLAECHHSAPDSRHPFLRELTQEGFLNAVDYGFSQHRLLLQQMEQEKSRELSDMQRYFPPYSMVSIQLNLSYIKILNAQGDFARAIPLASALVERLRSEVHRPNHSSWPNVQEELVSLLGAQGRLTEAEDLQRNVLRVRESENGSEHIVTAATCNNLAAILASASKFREALELFEKVLAINRRCLGRRHPSTIIAAHNRANMLVKLGMFDAAEVQFADCLEDFNQVFGKLSPLTFYCKNCFGLLLCSKGQYAAAQATLEAVYHDRWAVLGAEHHSTLTTLMNLAMLASERRNMPEAEKICRYVISAYERNMGRDHPQTQMILTDLGGVLISQGQYVEAAQILRHSLDILARSWGPRHQSTLDCACNLGSVLEKLNQFDEAIKICFGAYEGSKEAFGDKHPTTLRCLGNYVSALHQSETQLEKVCALQRLAVQGQEAVRGPGHRDTLTALNNLAAYELRRGDLGSAEGIFQDLCTRSEEVFGTQDLDVFRYRMNLAMVLESQGNVAAAEEMLCNISQQAKSWLEADEPLLMDAESNLAHVISRQNRWAETEDIYRSVLSRREIKFGPTHPDTTLVLRRFAVSLAKQNKLLEAENATILLIERLESLEFPDQAGLEIGNRILGEIRGLMAERQRIFLNVLPYAYLVA